jgi:hypothetical protein
LIAAFAVGIWRRMPSARLVGIAAAGLGLVITGLQVLDGETFDQHLLGLLIDGALLYYLSKRSVRELFES